MKAEAEACFNECSLSDATQSRFVTAFPYLLSASIKRALLLLLLPLPASYTLDMLLPG
jgi:hypothetical protein